MGIRERTIRVEGSLKRTSLRSHMLQKTIISFKKEVNIILRVCLTKMKVFMIMDN